MLFRSARVLYDLVHDALVDELRTRGIGAFRSAGEPDRDGKLLCFDRRAEGDVVVGRGAGDGGDDKIFGSAQRRLRGVVLQHGSLLLAASAGVPAEARHPGLEEVATPGGPWRRPGLEEVVGGWLGRIAVRIGAALIFEPGAFVPPDGGGYVGAVARFGDPAWIGRR